MWQGLPGKFKDYGGASGTITIGPGECLITLIVHASSANATFQVFGGATVPVINGANALIIQHNHTGFQANSLNAGTVIFTNTDEYYVVTWKAGN